MNIAVDISNAILKSDRVILRPFNEGDLDDFFEYAKVEGVGENAGWQHHQSKTESREILDYFMEQHRTFAIVFKDNNKVIGSIGIEKYNEKLVDDSFIDKKCCEIGYVLSKDYWGKGIMVEAVKLVLDYCFNDLKADAIFCGYFKRNIQSKRVGEKLGFKYYGDCKYETRIGTIEDTTITVMDIDDYNKSYLRMFAIFVYIYGDITGGVFNGKR